MNGMTGLAAYRKIAQSALPPRKSEEAAFRELIKVLRKGQDGSVESRNTALTIHQRFWSLIQKANAAPVDGIPESDRLGFASMANKAQRLGIERFLDQSLSLDILIEIAMEVLNGYKEK